MRNRALIYGLWVSSLRSRLFIRIENSDSIPFPSLHWTYPFSNVTFEKELYRHLVKLLNEYQNAHAPFSNVCGGKSDETFEETTLAKTVSDDLRGEEHPKPSKSIPRVKSTPGPRHSSGETPTEPTRPPRNRLASFGARRRKAGVTSSGARRAGGRAGKTAPRRARRWDQRRAQQSARRRAPRSD